MRDALVGTPTILRSVVRQDGPEFYLEVRHPVDLFLRVFVWEWGGSEPNLIGYHT